MADKQRELERGKCTKRRKSGICLPHSKSPLVLWLLWIDFCSVNKHSCWLRLSKWTHLLPHRWAWHSTSFNFNPLASNFNLLPSKHIYLCLHSFSLPSRSEKDVPWLSFMFIPKPLALFSPSPGPIGNAFFLITIHLAPSQKLTNMLNTFNPKNPNDILWICFPPKLPAHLRQQGMVERA